MIPVGTALSFSVEGQTSTSWMSVIYTPTMLRGDVLDRLGARMTVRSLTITPREFVLSGTLPWQFSAEIDVVTRVAYARAEDVGSIIANAFGRASGTMPVVTLGRGSSTPGVGERPGAPGFTWTTAIVMASAALIFLLWRAR